MTADQHPPVPAPHLKPAVPAPVRLACGLRTFAGAIGHIHDLNTFLELLKIGLVNTGVCAAVDFHAPAPDPTSDSDQGFGNRKLTVPLVIGDRSAAAACFSPPAEKQHFDAEDLHVLASLSEILSAAVDLSYRVARDRRALATLKAVLSLAPVGICAVDAEGRVQAINTLAAGWLALVEGDAITMALPSGMSFEEFRRGAAFHLRVGGRLLFCEARAQEDVLYTALVITDLTPEQGRLLDALSREVFRANHLRRPLQFLLLERAHPSGGLLAAMPAFRAALGRSAIVGPYDAMRVALIFPDAPWAVVLAHVRRVAATLPLDDVRIGHAEVVTHRESPEEIIDHALAAPETWAQVTRPRVLVHDGYGAVGESLRMVLAPKCDVTGSTDLGEARRLVQEQHFDAVLADSGPDAGALELVATARRRNVNVRAFLLSSMLPEGQSGQSLTADGVPVFSKPFNVELVRDHILASLGAGPNEAKK